MCSSRLHRQDPIDPPVCKRLKVLMAIVMETQITHNGRTIKIFSLMAKEEKEVVVIPA